MLQLSSGGRKVQKTNKQTNHSIQKLDFSSALCLLASYHLGVWIRSSVCFIAFPCRNVAASIQVFKVWRAILPVFLLLSHIQDSWRVLSSSPLSAVLLPFLQKSVFVAAVLTLPTPLSHIYIPNQVFIMDIEQMVMKSSCTLPAAWTSSPAHMNDLCTARCDVGWYSGYVLRWFGGLCPLGDRTVPAFYRASITATSPARPLNRSWSIPTTRVRSDAWFEEGKGSDVIAFSSCSRG